MTCLNPQVWSLLLSPVFLIFVDRMIKIGEKKHLCLAARACWEMLRAGWVTAGRGRCVVLLPVSSGNAFQMASQVCTKETDELLPHTIGHKRQ